MTRKKILFVHQNFPGQFPNLARHLSFNGFDVFALGEQKNIVNRGSLPGIKTFGYKEPEKAGEKTHPYLHPLEAGVRRGQTVARALIHLKQSGFVPDVIYAHPGWGESLFLRDVFPDAPLALFCEFYFNANKADLGFDPEFRQTFDEGCSVRIRNANQMLALPDAHLLISPTHWQATQYPPLVNPSIKVSHEGINTQYMQPGEPDPVTLYSFANGDSIIENDPQSLTCFQQDNAPPPAHVGNKTEQPPHEAVRQAPETPPASDESSQRQENSPQVVLGIRQAVAAAGLPEPRKHILAKGQKIITYMARNLEPYRGFHHFMRAVPYIQEKHPDAHILVIGNSGVSYSPRLSSGLSYKAHYLQQLRGSIDLERIHFVGRVSYPMLRNLFRLSSAHIYLTYPFVLSWSVMEAMATEALVIASATEPVKEVIEHNQNGLLVDFFDDKGIAATVCDVLQRPQEYTHLRKKARQTILSRFELGGCLGEQEAFIRSLL